jgi:hypothetical protein
MLRRLARIGLPPTSTKTGLVWLEGRIRSATQLERSMRTPAKRAGRVTPSARISVLATARR